MPRSTRELILPGHSALIVWDMQVGIGGRAQNLAQLQDSLQSLLRAARNRGVLVVWSRHVAPPLDLTSVSGLRSLMRRQGVDDPAQIRPAMQADTSDVQFIPELQPEPHDLVLEKSTPSFFVGTPLELRLRARGIETLVLTGVATEQGIEMTARHALALGFFVVVAKDAVGSFTTAGHELGLTYLESVVDVLRTAEIVTMWRE